MKMKRIVSRLMVCVLLLTAVPAIAGATDAPVKEKVIADFSKGTTGTAIVYDRKSAETVLTRAAIDTSVKYGDGQSTLAWTFNADAGVIIKIPYDTSWSSGYATFNMRFYTDTAGQRVCLPINEYDTFSSSKDNNYYFGAVRTTGAWQTYTVNVSELKGFWDTQTPDYVYIYLTSNGWGLVAGTEAEFNSGTKQSIAGKKMYIDKIWLENPNYGTPMQSPTTSIENNTGFVASDLGNNNTYTLTYAKDIYAYQDAVKVYEIVGKTVAETALDYEIAVDGKKLNIVFANSLPQGNYKITVDRERVIALTGEMAENDMELYFSVGQESILFNVLETSITNGAVLTNAPTQYVITFGTTPDETQYIPDYISLFKGTEKVYDAYEYAIDGKAVTLTFKKKLDAGEYTLKISPEYENVYGSAIQGTKDFSFVVYESTATDDMVMLFEAGNTSNMSSVITDSTGDVASVAEGSQFYDKTAKVVIKQGVNTRFRRPVDVNLAGMKYINYWIYSPEVSTDKICFANYTSLSENKYVYTPLERSWQGWKLITFPLSDFSGGVTYEKLILSLGGWGYTQSANSYLLVDAIWASVEKPTDIELVSSSFADGYTGAAVYGQILDLKFSGKLDANSTPTITVTKEDGTVVTDYVVSFDGDTMRIVFGQLEPSTPYEINISDIAAAQPIICTNEIKLGFTTESGSLSLKDVGFDKPQITTGEITAEFTLSNTTDADKDVTLYVTAVGASDATSKPVSKAVKVLKNSTTQTETLKVNCPAGATAVKAFVVTTEGNILTSKYFILDSEGESSKLTSKLSGDKALKLTSANVNVNILGMDITAAGVSDAVVVTITYQDGTVVHQDIVTANSASTVSKYLEITESAESGDYKITVSADGIKDEKTVRYLSKTDRDTLLSLANGTDKDALFTFLKANAGTFGASGADDELIEDIAEMTIAQDAFAVYADAFAYIAGTKQTFDKINTSAWAIVTTLIADNSSFFGGEADLDYTYFISLEEKNKNMLTAQLCSLLPADSITALNTLFEGVITNYKASLDGDFDAGDDEPEYDLGSPTISFSGGGGAGAPVQTPVEAAKTFTDLDSVEWAYDSIMKLYNAGVISAADDNKFRPDDNITREEFVKLVVCAFLEDTEASNYKFADAEADGWYNEYLAKAYSAGISTGYPDGSFGIGEKITREDMVTICARALEALGKDMTDGAEPSFKDAAAISDYAKKYVTALTKTGVINGMGDGTFAPKANATRAESAKVIAQLMEKY